MIILAVGDSYMAARYFREAFGGLEANHEVEYFDVDADRPFTPSTASESKLGEYQGAPAEVAVSNDVPRDYYFLIDRSGSMQGANGDLPGALTSYQAALAILTGLAKSNPSDAGTQRERHILLRENFFLTRNHVALHQSESELRSDEPEPINVTREQWIEQAEHCVQHP